MRISAASVGLYASVTSENHRAIFKAHICTPSLSAFGATPHPYSTMKKLLYILGGLFVVTVIAIIVMISKLGTIVKTAVNKVGPTITQTTFVLNSADISPFSGKGTLKELTIGNPKGWTTDHAFFLKEISIDLERNSITADHIVINSILIDNPEITCEVSGLNTNLQDLLKNIQQSTGSSQTAQTETKPATPAQPEAKPAKETKMEIKSFRLVNVTIKAAGAGNVYTVNIPDLVMTDLGTKEGGLTGQEMAIVIVKEISARAGKAVLESAAKKGLLDKASDSLRGLLGGKK
jgi:hypothetical protein